MITSPAATLVILPHNPGDVLMATPVLEGLRARHPRTRLSFLVEKGCEAGVVANPHVDKIHVFDRSKVRELLNGNTWEQGVAMTSRLLARAADTVVPRTINLSQTKYVACLAGALSGSDIRGFHLLPQGNFAVRDLWSQYLFCIPYARSCNCLHAVDVYRRMAGVVTHSGGYTLCIKKEEREEAVEFLDRNGIRVFDERVAVLQPGAAYPAKRWPREAWIALGCRLAEGGWRVLVSGAPAEKELAGAIAGEIGRAAVSSAGQTTLRQACALVSMARACISGDTALMHAAAACRVPVYALFGPTNPVETGPYGRGHHVFSARCDKRPCFCRECASHLCMKAILPDTVYATIERGRVPDNPHCDVAVTRCPQDGDYSLEPLTRAATWYNRAAAALTRAAFEAPAVLPDATTAKGACAQTRASIETITQMERSLAGFERTGRAEHIHRFEELKAGLGPTAENMSAFWTAWVNIRLNSIPLRDPHRAVIASQNALADIRTRLQRVVGQCTIRTP